MFHTLYSAPLNCSLSTNGLEDDGSRIRFAQVLALHEIYGQAARFQINKHRVLQGNP